MTESPSTQRPRGSYDAPRENRDLEAELARLEAQALLSWPVEARRLRWLGLRDGMRILELGCGPGYVTRELAALFPAAEITALDSDGVMLAHCRATLDRAGVAGVRLVAAPAADSGLPANHFDAVLSRYLFQHLADPEAVAREALRTLRGGGRHVVIDVDDLLWGLADPTYPQLRAIYERAAVAHAERGRRTDVGRRLGRVLRAAGYVDVEQDLFSYDSDALGLEAFREQLSADRLLSAQGAGALSLAEIALVHALVERFVEDPRAFVLFAGFIAVGTKP